MKKLFFAFSISFVMISLFASCGKSCTRGGFPDVRINRNDYVSDQDYNDAVAFYTGNGYTCQ